MYIVFYYEEHTIKLTVLYFIILVIIFVINICLGSVFIPIEDIASSVFTGKSFGSMPISNISLILSLRFVGSFSKNCYV